jgi:aspartate aminotransferase-like enzyme
MFTPGPVDVVPEVLENQAKPMIPHRTAAFDEIFRGTAAKQQQVFKTSNRIFQPPATGTGMQEAGVRNLVQQDVFSTVNGAFSQRWYQVALDNEKQANRLDANSGDILKPVLIEAFETFLEKM